MVKRREPVTAKREPTPQKLEAFISGADGGSDKPVQTLQSAPLVDINLIVPDPKTMKTSSTQKKHQLTDDF